MYQTEINIIAFSYEEIELYINNLVELDKILFNEMYWKNENFFRILPDKEKFSKILLYGNSLVGYIICSRNNDVIHIHRLGIHPDYQGKGFGRRLVKCIVKEVKCSGFNSLTVETGRNLHAEGFYKSVGFYRLIQADVIIEYLESHGRSDMLSTYYPVDESGELIFKYTIKTFR